MDLNENTPADTASEAPGVEQTTPDQAQPEGQQQQEPQQEQQQQEPVSYQDFQHPEGVTFDEAALGDFKGIAAEAGLTQEQAQKFVDIGVQMQQQWAAEQANAMQAASDQWAQSATDDPEFGGEALEQNLGVAKQALDKFGTPELKQLLNDSGLGNHPEVIRLLYRTGKAISNDRFVGGGRGAAQPRDPASILFPNQN